LSLVDAILPFPAHLACYLVKPFHDRDFRFKTTQVHHQCQTWIGSKL
jgi:hypothetical protein